VVGELPAVLLGALALGQGLFQLLFPSGEPRCICLMAAAALT
jgi:hypothetical protein